MFVTACDVLLSTTKFETNYKIVMELLGETVEKKLSQHDNKKSSVDLRNKIIDLMCHVLCQVYTGDISITPPTCTSSENEADSLDDYACRLLSNILA